MSKRTGNQLTVDALHVLAGNAIAVLDHLRPISTRQWDHFDATIEAHRLSVATHLGWPLTGMKFEIKRGFKARG